MLPARSTLYILLFSFCIIVALGFFINKRNQGIVISRSSAIFVEFSTSSNKPEVYVLSPESTIKDLCILAGCNNGIDEDILNEKLKNGEKIWIDSAGLLYRQRMDGFKLYTLGLKIPINEVTEDELSLIPGIGKKLAHEIIRRRDEIGGFKKYEQLLQVSGIGKKKLELIKEKTFITDE
jgi:competence protein ComEA